MAKLVANSFAELEKYLLDQIENSMRLLANDVKKLVKDYIYENLYQAYVPHEYQRTGQFLESVDVKVNRKGNIVEAEIFFNTDYLEMNEVEDSIWNQHMSVDGSEKWYGATVAEWMPVFIEWGTHNSLWDRDGLHSMETIQKYLETTQYHLKQIVQILKSKGINAVIK